MFGADVRAGVLYDNTFLPPQPPFGPRLDPGDRFGAQPFFTDDSGNVSSVTLALQAVGSPVGQLLVDIWDDDGTGVPGSSVGTVGSIDVSGLMTPGGLITVDGLVSGLALNTSYFVVLDAIGVAIDVDNSFRFGVVGPDDGTNGAAKFLVRVGADWEVLDDLLGPGPGGVRANYLRMAATSVAEPASAALVLLGFVVTACLRRRIGLHAAE